jgi:hypothetical protein
MLPSLEQTYIAMLALELTAIVNKVTTTAMSETSELRLTNCKIAVSVLVNDNE